MVFSDLIEETEAQQHPWSGLSGTGRTGVHQTAEAQIGKALGQFEATRTGQFQLLAGPGGSQTEPWGTIHRRYGGCNKQVRAHPFKAQGEEYKALEFYEAVMNTGIPLKVPSQRQ